MMYTQPLLTGFRAASGANEAAKKTRMAGKFLEWLKNSAKYGVGAGPGETITPAMMALRYGPDVFFGGMAGMQTPGDVGDKVIAGLTDTAASVVGGIGLTGLTRRQGTMGAFTDMIGSTAGMYAGFPVADTLMRTKDSLSGGSGQTPYEKLDEKRRREIEQNILAQYGLAGYSPSLPRSL